MPIDSNIVAAILGPFITALIGAGTLGFRQVQTARRADEERARIVSQAAQEAAFIDSWLSAHERLDLHPEQLRQVRERAIADLERVYRLLRSVDLGTDHFSRSFTLRRVLRALFLLPLHRPWAHVVRVFYYGSLAAGFTLVVASVLAVVDQPATYTGVGDVLFKILVSAMVTVALLVPSVILWVVARALDRPAPARRTPPTPLPYAPPPPPPGTPPPGTPPPSWSGRPPTQP